MIFADKIEGAPHISQEITSHRWQENELGQTLLHLACMNDNMEAASILLKAGYNIDATTTDGRTALINAAFMENDNILQFLVTNGANTNIRDIYGKNAVDYIAEKLDTPAEFLMLWRSLA